MILSKYSDLAYNAYRNTSFSPEKRRDTIIKECSEELERDLLIINNEEDKARYQQGYEKHFVAWMSAKSRCISAMITGPARFPVAKAEKANEMEVRRGKEFFDWREKSLKVIARKEELKNKPQGEAKESEVEIINGVKVVRNFKMDRLQLFFDGKPEQNVIQMLKSTAWKWSPTNKCWQRKLTTNAVYASNKILNLLND